mgnify:CR=1 FL=1
MSNIEWILIIITIFLVILLFRYIQLKKQIRNLADQVNELNSGNSQQMLDISLIDKDLERLAGILNQYNIRQRQAVAGVLRNEEYLKESVANISHDLRTPLTVILGHLQLLQKENLESSQAQRVKVIFSKAEKMKELVETFYDLSILEEQQTVPEKEKFNISNMLINLITENAVALEKENILPEINLPDYSIYVYSDKNMVERILQNLLTNAIKYSVGTIKITLMEKENNNIIFTIENPMSDSSEIDCNRLFDRFYTGDKSRHNGSTGLGLAVHFGKLINKGGLALQKGISRFVKTSSDVPEAEFEATLVTCITLFCASGTGIYGSIIAGMSADHSVLIAKAILDLFTAVVFACTLGMVTAAVAIPQFIIFFILQSPL